MADDKIGLWDMVLQVGDEITRLESWQTVLEKDGKALSESQARSLAVWRKTQATLELLVAFEKPFVDLVKAEREKQRARLAAAPQMTTQKLSPPPDPKDETAVDPQEVEAAAAAAE